MKKCKTVCRYIPVLALVIIALIAFTGCEKPVSLSPEVQAVTTYTFGETREPLAVVEDMVRDSYGDAEKRLNLEKQFAVVLGMETATYEAKDFACRQLILIGTDESVPALAALLSDAKLSNRALYALDQNPSSSVDKALDDALGKTEGLPLVGIINIIGSRKDAAVISKLQDLAGADDEMVAKAASVAISRIQEK